MGKNWDIEKKVDILKINASDFKADALRPSYSVLDCTETENLLNIKQKNWDVELRKVMVELKNDILQKLITIYLLKCVI